MVSIEHLRRYVDRSGSTPLPTGPAIQDPAVVRVLGERMWNGSREILCLHDGGTDADAVWEDVDVLEGDLRLLREFRERWAVWVAPPPVTETPTAAPRVSLDTATPATPGPRRSGRVRRPSSRALGA